MLKSSKALNKSVKKIQNFLFFNGSFAYINETYTL